MLTKDNVTIGIEWRFKSDYPCARESPSKPTPAA